MFLHNFELLGTFKAPYKIGPMETIVEFHVMDITPNYNLFLGRAWLHPIRAIPSSLHQKMKIPWKGEIVVVLGNVEIQVSIYGLEEGGSEFQMNDFEFVNMAYYGLKDEKYTTDLLSYCINEVIAMMKNMGYMPSKGFGKEGKRWLNSPISRLNRLRNV